MNFWQKLPKPFFILAPMDDVTDTVFRQVVIETARPDVLFSEFTNVDGLNSRGREKLMPRLWFEDQEHPIVAQIWGKIPENFYKAAKDLVEMGFDGIDLNMGCPERGVVSNGACAALIENHNLAKQIIDATIEGANGLPVSVKTRIGIGEIKTEEWISFLLGFNLAAIAIHGRTVKEMSKVPAHWDEIAKAVEIRDQLQGQRQDKILIIGNGDIKSYKEGLSKAKEFGVDGVMVGTGIFQNPWIFQKGEVGINKTKAERLKLLLFHARLFDKTWGKNKNFNILKKFFKIYVSGFEGAQDLRVKLMETQNLEQVEQIIKSA